MTRVDVLGASREVREGAEEFRDGELLFRGNIGKQGATKVAFKLVLGKFVT